MKKDLSGKRFGKLLVKSVHSRSRNGHIRWSCVCDCGGSHDVLSTHLLSGKITHCGCIQYRGKSNKLWSGCGEISGNFWTSLVRGANGLKGRKPIEFEITIEYIWDLFLKQNRKCALSGLPIWFPNTTTQTQSKTASLDRIDSSKGYVMGNVQWVHKDINKMKNSFSQEYFIMLCNAVSGNSCEIV